MCQGKNIQHAPFSVFAHEKPQKALVSKGFSWYSTEGDRCKDPGERSPREIVPGPSTMDIRFITYDEGLDKVFYIRKVVFVEEQGVPPEEEIDEQDKTATHILVFDSGVPVGTGRVFEKEEQWYIGRLAVLRESRGKGIGRLIMEKLTAFAREKGAKRITVHAQTNVIDFYRILGYQEQGQEFMDAGIPHKEMYRVL